MFLLVFYINFHFMVWFCRALIHASVTGLTVDFHFYWPNNFRAWFEIHYGFAQSYPSYEYTNDLQINGLVTYRINSHERNKRSMVEVPSKDLHEFHFPWDRLSRGVMARAFFLRLILEEQIIWNPFTLSCFHLMAALRRSGRLRIHNY